MFNWFGGTNTIFSALAYFLINKLGRRTLISSSLGPMFPFLIATGFVLNVTKNESSSTEVIVLVLIYTAIYSPDAGVGHAFSRFLR